MKAIYETPKATLFEVDIQGVMIVSGNNGSYTEYRWGDDYD